MVRVETDLSANPSKAKIAEAEAGPSTRYSSLKAVLFFLFLRPFSFLHRLAQEILD